MVLAVAVPAGQSAEPRRGDPRRAEPRRPQAALVAQAPRNAEAPRRDGSRREGSRSTTAAPRGNEETIALNFREAEIESVIGAFGQLLNKTFVVDPRVRGKISLETPRPVTKAMAFTLLKTVLRQQGFAVVDIGSLVKVVPEADAKLQSGPVETSRMSGRTGDEIVTQIFQLNHESATNMIPVLRPLVSPNNTITAFPNNNSLVVTDYAANVSRLGRIIANLDNPQAANDVQVIPVKHTIATDVAVAVSRLLDETSRGGNTPGAAVDPGQRVTILADPRTNTVLLRTSSAAKMKLAQSLVKQLDQPASGEQANMRVVYLRNAEAIKLVEVLRAVLSGDQSSDHRECPRAAIPTRRGACWAAACRARVQAWVQAWVRVWVRVRSPA
jgi:general secretion pathway protein D